MSSSAETTSRRPIGYAIAIGSPEHAEQLLRKAEESFRTEWRNRTITTHSNGSFHPSESGVLSHSSSYSSSDSERSASTTTKNISILATPLSSVTPSPVSSPSKSGSSTPLFAGTASILGAKPFDGPFPPAAAPSTGASWWSSITSFRQLLPAIAYQDLSQDLPQAAPLDTTAKSDDSSVDGASGKKSNAQQCRADVDLSRRELLHKRPSSLAALRGRSPFGPHIQNLLENCSHGLLQGLLGSRSMLSLEKDLSDILFALVDLLGGKVNEKLDGSSDDHRARYRAKTKLIESITVEMRDFFDTFVAARAEGRYPDKNAERPDNLGINLTRQITVDRKFLVPRIARSADYKQYAQLAGKTVHFSAKYDEALSRAIVKKILGELVDKLRTEGDGSLFSMSIIPYISCLRKGELVSGAAFSLLEQYLTEGIKVPAVGKVPALLPQILGSLRNALVGTQAINGFALGGVEALNRAIVANLPHVKGDGDSSESREGALDRAEAGKVDSGKAPKAEGRRVEVKNADVAGQEVIDLANSLLSFLLRLDARGISSNKFIAKRLTGLIEGKLQSALVPEETFVRHSYDEKSAGVALVDLVGSEHKLVTQDAWSSMKEEDRARLVQQNNPSTSPELAVKREALVKEYFKAGRLLPKSLEMIAQSINDETIMPDGNILYRPLSKNHTEGGYPELTSPQEWQALPYEEKLAIKRSYEKIILDPHKREQVQKKELGLVKDKLFQEAQKTSKYISKFIVWPKFFTTGFEKKCEELRATPWPEKTVSYEAVCLVSKRFFYEVAQSCYRAGKFLQELTKDFPDFVLGSVYRPLILLSRLTGFVSRMLLGSWYEQYHSLKQELPERISKEVETLSEAPARHLLYNNIVERVLVEGGILSEEEIAAVHRDVIAAFPDIS